VRRERDAWRHERVREERVRRHERGVEQKRDIVRQREIKRREISRSREVRERRAEGAERGRRIRFTERQRWRVRDYYRHHRHRFHRVARVPWPIVIGGYVPRDYVIYDIPEYFYEYVPGYEGYKYIVVDGKLIIIDPYTWEIVAIIDL
jgi:hypothetical protein